MFGSGNSSTSVDDALNVETVGSQYAARRYSVNVSSYVSTDVEKVGVAMDADAVFYWLTSHIVETPNFFAWF